MRRLPYEPLYFGLTHRSESKKKYWYKQKPGKPGNQLPEKYKRMFSNKQIVCIEYMEISEADEREIFRVRFDRDRHYAELTPFIPSVYNWGWPSIMQRR